MMIGEFTRPWKEIELELPASVAEDVAALLVEAGAAGAELLEAEPRDQEPRCRLRVAFPASLSDAELLRLAREVMGQLGLTETDAEITVRLCTDAQWAHAWREHYRPLRAGERLWVVPSWERDVELPAGAVVLELDPGLAFGTGQHPSTLLSLELMEAYLASLDEAARRRLQLLDVGCGSGILAIAAAKLGVGHTLGVDIDPEAVRIARDNVALNGVAEQVEVEQRSAWDIHGRYGCVVANMLGTTLVAVCHDLVRCMAEEGRLILGGLLAAEEQELVEAFAHAAAQQGRRLGVITRRTQADWVELMLG